MEQARNLFTAGFTGISAGISLIQHVTSSAAKGYDSSDDENADLAEDEEFIQHGARGIIVFTTMSIRTGKKKMIHINLARCTITQYHDNKKKVFSCSDVQTISKNTDKFIVVEFRGAMDVQSKQKRFFFDFEQSADKFLQYVEFISEFGKPIRQAFTQIDFTKSNKIGRDDLEQALAKVDLHIDDEKISRMLQFATAGFECIDYYNFFHMFLRSYVTNMRECLTEWANLATDESTSINEPLQQLSSPFAATASLSSSSASIISISNASTHFDLLPGEIVTLEPKERLYWCIYSSRNVKEPFFVHGLLYVTNFRVILTSQRKKTDVHQSKHSRFDIPTFFDVISIPLTTISKMYMGVPHNSIYIVCKDYRLLRITLSGFENNRNRAETYFQFIMNLAFYSPNLFPGGSSKDPALVAESAKSLLFAYQYQPIFSLNDNAWNMSDIIKEYVRLGLYDAKSEWKMYDNTDYALSDTYPRYLMLPALMSPEQIKAAAAFRSRGRLPVITYRHVTTGALLTRSAQPLVGLTQKNCPEDEFLLNLYRMKGKDHPPGSTKYAHSKLYILDARGKIAATLNMAAGKGTEDVSSYQNTELVFGNIDNIHVMRSSATSLTDNISSIFHPHVGMKEVIQSSDGGLSGYFSRVEDSGWLRHLRLVLLSGIFTAERLHFDGDSVLVHCSDGWDRTAQICSVAEILLDPYYRTVEGFAVLIEKEWCAFGHKFQDRIGQGQDSSILPDEKSPVFLQFLDSVFQILIQFPSNFEFTEEFLLFIADHSASCLFGNFLGNNEKDRRNDLQVPLLTQSIWAYVLEYRVRFTNPTFRPYDGPIWPSTSMHRIKLWERYWLRWDMTAHPNSLHPENAWDDDWGDKGIK